MTTKRKYTATSRGPLPAGVWIDEVSSGDLTLWFCKGYLCRSFGDAARIARDTRISPNDEDVGLDDQADEE